MMIVEDWIVISICIALNGERTAFAGGASMANIWLGYFPARACLLRNRCAPY